MGSLSEAVHAYRMKKAASDKALLAWREARTAELAAREAYTQARAITTDALGLVRSMSHTIARSA